MSGARVKSQRIRTPDGVSLHVEEAGEGPPVLFLHELLGNAATYAPVIDRLKDRYRCIAFNSRGYPPSDVPPFSPATYSGERTRDDVIAVMDALGLDKVRLVGVSMGAAFALNVALAAPRRVVAMVITSIGTGSDADPHVQAAQIEATAVQFDGGDMAALLREQEAKPNRRTMIDTQPESWALFSREFMKLSPAGLANTLRGIQKNRPPLYTLETAVKQLQVPAVVVLGSEDAPCRKPCEFLARTLPHGRLEVVQGAGHIPNLEQPERFAQICAEAFAAAAVNNTNKESRQ